MKNSDDKLVKKAKMGDNGAFGKLVARYQKKVLYLAYDLIGNYYDAQDVAQNVFFQAFKNITFFKAQSSFSTWLYRITTNAAIDFQRSKKRRWTLSLNRPLSEDKDERELIDVLQDKSKPVDEKFEDQNLKDLIEKTTESLPPQQQAAFVLKYFHGKPTEEIAEILNCDPITVRGHILRATLKLRKQLKAEK